MNDGGLAGPVRADQAGNFSRADLERNIVDGGELAESFRQALDGNEHRDTLRQRRVHNKQRVVIFFCARTLLTAWMTPNQRHSLRYLKLTAKRCKLTNLNRLKLINKIRIVPLRFISRFADRAPYDLRLISLERGLPK